MGEKNVPNIPSVPWTKVHGFYTLMGGFALDFKSSDSPFVTSSVTRMTLTPEGLFFLLNFEPTLLPTITEAEINDKSKASNFAKFIACSQALWFCLQCLARTVQGLPVSLLEVSTIAHAFCALLIYVLWWEKPLEVEQPTLIRIEGEKLRAICAYMWMASGASSCDGNGSDLPEFDWLDYKETSYNEEQNPTEFPINVMNKLDHEGSKQVMRLTGFSLRSKSTRFIKTSSSPNGSAPTVTRLPVDCSLSKVGFTRWTLASQAIRDLGLARPTSDLNLLVQKAQEFPRYKGEVESKWVQLLLNMGITLVLGFYGGIHALAWNHPFISPGEQLYWRASSVLLISPALWIPLQAVSMAARRLMADLISLGISVAISKSLSKVFGHWGASWRHSKFFGKRKIISWISTSIFILLVVILVVAASLVISMFAFIWVGYIGARFYVVVLSFKDLWYLQEEVFKRPIWTLYIPHIA
jgi:hypothetical protein